MVGDEGTPVEGTVKPLTDSGSLPANCHRCGATDRKLMYEPDDEKTVRGVCSPCRHERGSEKPPVPADSL
jgi:hypothetical protein